MPSAVSLIGLGAIQPEHLETLASAGIRRVSLVPDNFDYTASASLTSTRRQLNQYGLRVDSIQGLFFGVDTDLDSEVFARTHLLKRICFELEIPLAVVGSPVLRATPNRFLLLVDNLRQQLIGTADVAVENICFCQTGQRCVPFAGGEVYFDLVFDYSNFLECTHGADVLTLAENPKLIHFAGPGHSVPEDADFLHLSGILGKLPATVEITIETPQACLKERISAALRLEN